MHYVECRRAESHGAAVLTEQDEFPFPFHFGQIHCFRTKTSLGCVSTRDFSFVAIVLGRTENAGNTKRGSITVRLTSCLTVLESAV